ncbi:MAG: signal peptidase I [Lachnospiraceae bacterium]|nr:signal peptidase I [Lachnospiraceae bacterium]
MALFSRNELSFRHHRRRIRLGAMRQVLIIIIEIAAALVLAFLLVYGLGLRVNVSGNSMETTLSDGESVFVNRLAYRVGSPKSGDVVVFMPNGNEKSPYYIKRVVAAPGDSVQIKDGVIYVNDVMFDDKDTEAVADAGLAEEKLTMGDDEYFVIGDNRNSSEDSRYTSFGNVKKEYIIGKAWFHYDAINDLGRVK